jgi:hypothetical protein
MVEPLTVAKDMQRTVFDGQLWRRETIKKNQRNLILNTQHFTKLSSKVHKVSRSITLILSYVNC